MIRLDKLIEKNSLEKKTEEIDWKLNEDNKNIMVK